jgi:hypothetical protein
MSNYLSEEVRKCRQKAEDCAQRASTQVDPRLKKDFLELQKSWPFWRAATHSIEGNLIARSPQKEWGFLHWNRDFANDPSARQSKRTLPLSCPISCSTSRSSPQLTDHRGSERHGRVSISERPRRGSFSFASFENFKNVFENDDNGVADGLGYSVHSRKPFQINKRQ